MSYKDLLIESEQYVISARESNFTDEQIMTDLIIEFDIQEEDAIYFLAQ